jgi:uncharacterized alpha-E superfamily protein
MARHTMGADSPLSMRHTLDELRARLEAIPRRGTPQRAKRTAMDYCRRHPAITLAVAGAIIVAVAAVAYLIFRRRA